MDEKTRHELAEATWRVKQAQIKAADEACDRSIKEVRSYNGERVSDERWKQLDRQWKQAFENRDKARAEIESAYRSRMAELGFRINPDGTASPW